MIPIVDAHLHLWDLTRFEYPWLDDPQCRNLRWNYLPGHWLDDAAGLDIVATVHVQAEMTHSRDPVEETAWLASLADHAPEQPVPTVCIGYANLRSPDLDDFLVRHQDHSLFRGIRQEAWFDPRSTRADVPRDNLLDDPAWVAGLRNLDRRGLSFDLLVWPQQLRQAAGIFRELPSLTVVLEHVGLPGAADSKEQWRADMRLFARQVPRSMLKISALSFISTSWDLTEMDPLVREAMEIFGPDRCLFGSNFPVDRSAVSYQQLWASFDSMTADLSPGERSAMFSGNAADVYRINLPDLR